MTPSCQLPEPSTQPLALTRPVFDRETPVSLVSGIAHKNFYDSASDFCRDLGLDLRSIFRGEQAEVSRLAQLAGAEEKELQRWTFRNVGRAQIRIGREAGNIRTICRSIPRICPACVLTAIDQYGFCGAFIRADWQVVSIRTCDIHQQPLMRLPFSKYTVQNYEIGAIIRRHFGLIQGQAHPHRPESALEAYLRARLAGQRRSEIWPDCFTLPVVARAAEMLGGRILFGSRMNAAQLSEDMLYEAGAIGFDVLSAGKRALQDCLTRLSQEDARLQKFHNRDYGMFLKWLRSSRGTPNLRPLKNLVRDHLVENFPLTIGTTILGSVIRAPKQMSLSKASKSLGMSPNRLRRMSQEKELSSRGIRHSLVEELRSEINDLITIREAMRILGCSYDFVHRLAEAELLQFQTRGSGARYIKRRQAAEILRAVNDLAEIDQPCNLHAPTSIRKKLGCKISTTLELFLAGRLSTAYRAREVSGVCALLVDITEVRALIAPSHPKLHRLPEICQILRLPSPAVYKLISEGYLRSIMGKNQVTARRCMMICSDSLDSFLARFVTLGMLVIELKREPPNLLRDLKALGVRPTFSEEIISQVYERSALPDLAPLFNQKRRRR